MLLITSNKGNSPFLGIRIGLAILCSILSFTLSATAQTMPVPSGQGVYTFGPQVSPVLDTDPSRAKPMGVGQVAQSGSTLSIQIGAYPFSQPVDVYFGIQLPNSPEIYLLTAGNGAMPVSQASSLSQLTWKPAFAGQLNEQLFGSLPTSALPSGTYYLYLLVLPTGSFSSYYIWVTSFTVSSSTASIPAYKAAAWEPMGGPPGDLGYDIRYNFADHNIWYVTDGAGGFFISSDRGQTWKASNKGIAPLEGSILRPVFSATVDPHDPQTIWIGTQLTGHIYKSTDGGQNWVQKDNGISQNQGHHFRGFTVDPKSSNTVYAQAELNCTIHSSGCSPTKGSTFGRVYRTTDGGDNWIKIWEGDALARYLWIDPGDTNVLYVSTGIFDRSPYNNSGVGVVKSIDGGKTWTTLGQSNGLTNLYVGSLYMKPGQPKTLLAGTGVSGTGEFMVDPETGKEVRSGGVFLTTDGGDTWTKVVKNDLIGAVEFCEQDPKVAYAAGLQATYRSEDGGVTWKKFGDEIRGTWGPPGLNPGTPIDMQTDPDDCSRVFINNYIGGNFLSTDGAETWKSATVGYSGAMVHRIKVDLEDAAHIYATPRMAPFSSRDGGRNWEGLANGDLLTSLDALAIDPADGYHLIGSTILAYYTTSDGGATWEKHLPFPLPTGVNPDDYKMTFTDFAFAPSNPQIVYGCTRLNDIWKATANGDPEELIRPAQYAGLGIFRSTDGGATWQQANDASTAEEGFNKVIVDPKDPQTVYAAGYWSTGLFKTTNGGQSWKSINSGLPSPYPRVYGMDIDHQSPYNLIITGTAGIFRTTNGGSSWTQVTSGVDTLTNYREVVYDPSNGQVVYLANNPGGVFYSTDGGASFKPLTQGFDTSVGSLPAFSLGISSDGSVLYTGTKGSGVWRLGTPASK